jgi:membrane protein implicated in regulation of membrane protease activity
MGSTAWVVLGLLLLLLELFTTQMICIWFAVGSFIAAITAMFGYSLNAQITAFLLASLISLIPGRYLVMKRLLRADDIEPTNLDRVVGKTSEVGADGRVYVEGLSWCVKSDDTIVEGDYVKVLKIEGVTLLVEKVVVE